MYIFFSKSKVYVSPHTPTAGDCSGEFCSTFGGANVCAFLLLLLLLLEKKKIEQKLTNKWSFFVGERLLFYPSSTVQGIVAYIFFPAMSVLPGLSFAHTLRSTAERAPSYWDALERHAKSK